MKLSELLNSFLQILRTESGYVIRRENETFTVEILEEDGNDLESVLALIDFVKKENLSQAERDGIKVGRLFGGELTYTEKVFDHLNKKNTQPLRKKTGDEPEEMFGSSHGDLHPDILPSFDQRIFKRKPNRGMFMGPDDILNSEFELEPGRDRPDPADPFARYDEIRPGKNRYKGPDPDHLRKPGGDLDKDFF